MVPETEIDSAPTSKIVCSRELEERVIFRIVSAFTALFRMNLSTYAISLLDNSLSQFIGFTNYSISLPSEKRERRLVASFKKLIIPHGELQPELSFSLSLSLFLFFHFPTSSAFFFPTR